MLKIFQENYLTPINTFKHAMPYPLGPYLIIIIIHLYN